MFPIFKQNKKKEKTMEKDTPSTTTQYEIHFANRFNILKYEIEKLQKRAVDGHLQPFELNSELDKIKGLIPNQDELDFLIFTSNVDFSELTKALKEDTFDILVEQEMTTQCNENTPDIKNEQAIFAANRRLKTMADEGIFDLNERIRQAFKNRVA
jgi:hypothetical protein